MAGKGKWAQGIPPRNFAWIMKDRLAVSERPGGYGVNHRRVRRQEEIIWVREQGFTCVVSIIPAPHNLHNYDELGVNWRHRGFENTEEPAPFIAALYPELQQMLADGEKILLHADTLDDTVCGLLTGYLVWTGLVPEGPEAVTLIERMVKRQLGPYGRELVSTAAELESAAPAAREALAAARRASHQVASSVRASAGARNRAASGESVSKASKAPATPKRTGRSGTPETKTAAGSAGGKKKAAAKKAGKRRNAKSTAAKSSTAKPAAAKR